MKKTETQIQYIYRLIDPITKCVVYIGKTKNLKKRFGDHKRLRKNKYETRLEVWKNNLIKSGYFPIMEIITECNEFNANELERFYIKSYREMGINILNSTDGGDGLQNPSEETRRKIGLKSKGRIPSEETRRKISESSYNKGISIKCYNHLGEFIKEFINSRRASEELKISHKSISKTLNEKCHFISNLTFFYSNDPNIDTKIKIRLSNKIDKGVTFIRISKNGDLKYYSNIVKASKDLKVNFRNIWMCLQGERKTCGGFAWCYENEYDENYSKYFERKKSKKVLLIKDTLSFIFDSLSIASKETKIHKSTICNYINGKISPKDKSIWKYIQ